MDFLLQSLLTATFLNALTEATLTCLYCNDAVSPVDCDTVVKCGAHERCFVDGFVSALGSIRYNLGCRDENQCGSSINAGKRELSLKSVRIQEFDEVSDNVKGLLKTLNHSIPKSVAQSQSRSREISNKRSHGLLICSECCSGNLCSSRGCGYTGYQSQRGPICFNCAQQSSTDDCSKIQICGQDEVCMLIKHRNPMSHELRYTTQCEGEKRCKGEIVRYKELAALLIGKRGKRDSLEIGDSCLVQCCTTDMCNTNCANGSTSELISTQEPSFVQTHLTTTTSPSPITVQRTTTTESTAFCIYKSKKYNQGDVWQDGCQYNCTCEDARTGFYRCQDLCPVWNNLPAGCTLEKKPGECCSQPYCGGSTLPTMTDTCFYGGKYYREGENWRDGCKYKCTCQDGKTGFYQCQTLCLQWTLPSSCHLDPPPAGKCCEVPVCPSNVQLQFPPGFIQE